MISDKIRILEQNIEDFENPEIKNQYIREAGEEWLGFVNEYVTNQEEVMQILEENSFLEEYDVILFGKNVPDGKCNLFDLLERPQSEIYAFIFRKKLLIYAGSYNQCLLENINYEFLLRLSEQGSVYSIPCIADTYAKFNPTTMAYIVRRYMELLKANGKLEQVFLGMAETAQQLGVADLFTKEMNVFLGNNEEYDRISSDTAPFFIMVCNDGCYGVVAGFADYLADELVGLGQAVITTNGRYGDYMESSLEELAQRNYKAIIGFQSSALEIDFFRELKGERYQFWFDDPFFSGDFLRQTSKTTHFLCQDANYAKFIKEHYGIENAIQFPPAGSTSVTDSGEKIYDIVFVGSYLVLPKGDYENAFHREIFELCMNHADYTFEEAIKVLWQKQGVAYDEHKFMQQVEELQDVCFDILQNYRHRVVESILSAGIPLHVFGDSWQQYQGEGRENLMIHPQITGEDALCIYGKAKIGLNIMNGHKAGMTERIANIMLGGACCLSDETIYLKEHFRDGENIVFFHGDRLEQLPGKIQYLLQHDDVREKIAMAGRKKALDEHTWRKRAEELLEIVK